MSPAQADDVSFEQLLQRLQQTEQRVRDLEQQQATPFLPASFADEKRAPLIPPPIDEETSAKKPADEKKEEAKSGSQEAGDQDKEDKDKKDDKEKEPTFEDRLKKLEKGWKELDEAWGDFEKAEAKKKADAAKKPTLKINGRIHADYWNFIDDNGGVGFFENPLNGGGPAATLGADPEDRFAFRRIRLEMSGDCLETMLWRIQVDFNKPAEAEIKDVYIGFKELPGNQTLLIGNQKRPIGLDHLNSSRYNIFLERPMVIEAFNEDARRPGICTYGHTDDESLIWAYGMYYLESLNTSGQTLGDQRQMSGNARLAGSPWYDESSGGRGYYHWGLSGMIAKPDGNDTASDFQDNEGRFRTRPEARSTNRWMDTGRIRGADWYETIGIEQMFNVGPLQITGEYLHNFMQRDGFSDVQFHGGYVYVSYMLTGEHVPYERDSGTLGRLQPFENFFLVDRCGGGHGCGWGAWGVAARYSYLDLSNADILGGVGESATLALNWYWTAYSKMQFNLIYGDIHDRNPAVGATHGNYLIAGTRLAIEF
ncbi:MAG: porin [Planctomycetaceae bacterium]